MVHELARLDPRVVFIGSDLSPGMLDSMKAEMPARHYMEGVMEQHLVGMAAGMAMDGMMPFFNTIATFITRRCYEQVALDLCLHDLPVRLIANGGGVVYAPLGPDPSCRRGFRDSAGAAEHDDHSRFGRRRDEAADAGDVKLAASDSIFAWARAAIRSSARKSGDLPSARAS